MAAMGPVRMMRRTILALKKYVTMAYNARNPDWSFRPAKTIKKLMGAKLHMMFRYW